MFEGTSKDLRRNSVVFASFPPIPAARSPTVPSLVSTLLLVPLYRHCRCKKVTPFGGRILLDWPPGGGLGWRHTSPEVNYGRIVKNLADQCA
jgi:hypothetical protein